MPSSTSTETRPGRHGPPRLGVGGQDPDHRRELGEPSLLAADAEHLDRRRRPAASRPLSSRLHSCERCAPRLGLVEAPVAQRDRRAVVLGDVEHERLRASARRSRSSAADLAPGRRRGRPARRRSATRQAIASARISVSPSSSPRSRASVSIARISSSELVPRDQYERTSTVASPAPVAELRGPSRSRWCARCARALVLALEVERRARARRAARRAARSCRRRARSSPPRAARPRPGRRSRAASTRPRSRSRRARAARRRPSSRAIAAVSRERLERVERVARRDGSPCRARGRPPRARRGRRSRARARCAAASPASSKASAARGRPRPRAGCTRCRAAAPSERRGGGEVVREVGERAPERPSARLERLAHAQVQLGPPQRREPVVERAAHELVREAVGEPARGQLLDHAAAHRLVERREQVGLGRARRRAGRCRARTRARRWPRARAGRSSRAPAARAAG